MRPRLTITHKHYIDVFNAYLDCYNLKEVASVTGIDPRIIDRVFFHGWNNFPRIKDRVDVHAAKAVEVNEDRARKRLELVSSAAMSLMAQGLQELQRTKLEITGVIDPVTGKKIVDETTFAKLTSILANAARMATTATAALAALEGSADVNFNLTQTNLTINNTPAERAREVMKKHPHLFSKLGTGADQEALDVLAASTIIDDEEEEEEEL